MNERMNHLLTLCVESKTISVRKSSVNSYNSSSRGCLFVFFPNFQTSTFVAPRSFVSREMLEEWRARRDVCFQELFWKSVADRGTFSRGSKSWGRGWLLLIKTWPSLGSPIGFQVCVFNVYVSRYPLYVRTYACLRLYARRNRGFVQVEGGTNSVSIVIRSMLLHITPTRSHLR